VSAALLSHALAKHAQRLKVRVLLARAGTIAIESAPVEALSGARVGIARRPISTRSPFVYHKTTNRRSYDAAVRLARRDLGELYDVLLWNDAGMVTESCYANVVVDLDGRLVTPSLGQGLLPGVFRRSLIEQRVIEERDVTLEQLRRADRLFLVNSVRGWMTLKKPDTGECWCIESEGSFTLPG
jgi:para-aminobenzoate synthetase/4-amino-4-deoxychorismate lyase